LAGLFFDAAKKWQIDLNKSYMIGDNWKDIEAAKTANIDSFLLDTNYNQDYFCEYRINSLKDVSQLIGK
jgi:D-glycero-D-manno-heptose 1,7-bisphosphate phosphatase